VQRVRVACTEERRPVARRRAERRHGEGKEHRRGHDRGHSHPRCARLANAENRRDNFAPDDRASAGIGRHLSLIIVARATRARGAGRHRPAGCPAARRRSEAQPGRHCRGPRQGRIRSYAIPSASDRSRSAFTSTIIPIATSGRLTWRLATDRRNDLFRDSGEYWQLAGDPLGTMLMYAMSARTVLRNSSRGAPSATASSRRSGLFARAPSTVACRRVSRGSGGRVASPVRIELSKGRRLEIPPWP